MFGSRRYRRADGRVGLYAPLVPKVLEIGPRCGCTVYDALYLPLVEAQREEGGAGAVALTADGRLLRRLEGTLYEDLGADIAP